MKDVKVLISDPVDQKGIEMMEKAGFILDVKTQKKTPAELAEMILPYQVLVVRSASKVTKEVIEKGQNLKVIARGGVGLDNIDVETAKTKGITVLNTPDSSTLSVAELTIAHILALSRNLISCNLEMRKGNWPKSAGMGTEVAGKTLGVLGFGRIGRCVAQIAQHLGMKVIASDIFLQNSNMDGVKLVDKETLLKEADIITLHMPTGNGPEIGKAEFEKMKDGVIIINISRGGLIDEKALLEALNSGKVSKAGIDVFEKEPTDNVELVNHPNVCVTPHLGASTKEAQKKVSIELAEKIIEVFKN